VRLDGLGTNYLETRHRIGYHSVPCASWCCIVETTLLQITVICNQAQTCVTVVNLVSFPVLSQIKPQAPVDYTPSYSLRHGLHHYADPLEEFFDGFDHKFLNFVGSNSTLIQSLNYVKKYIAAGIPNESSRNVSWSVLFGTDSNL
jgi:hypothetical protein